MRKNIQVMAQETIKIVYLQLSKTPMADIELLYFFTEKNNKIYWGTDNNSIDPAFLESWLRRREILKLKTPIVIDEDETLLIDHKCQSIYKTNMLHEYKKQIGSLKDLVV